MSTLNSSIGTKLVSEQTFPKIKKLVAWCQSHDWGAAVIYCEETGTIDNVVDNDGERAKFISFRCENKLKAWAGY